MYFKNDHQIKDDDVEPNITELPKVLGNRKNMKLVSLEEADVVAVLVNHKEFSTDSLNAVLS